MSYLRIRGRKTGFYIHIYIYTNKYRLACLLFQSKMHHFYNNNNQNYNENYDHNGFESIKNHNERLDAIKDALIKAGNFIILYLVDYVR